MNLRALTIEDMEPIRKWRNECLDTLRTPFPLTKEQQEDWYKNEICNRNSRSRFWAIDEAFFSGQDPFLIGYGGIENIQWENRIGEISLLINPERKNHGHGSKAARFIIGEAFERLNLLTVYAECYANNPAIKFWAKIFGNQTPVVLPNRKYCNGQYYDSFYFSMSRA